MNRIINFSINHYFKVLILIITLTIPFTYFYINQHYLNSIDVFFEKDNPDILYYEYFQKVFGNEEIVAIVFKDNDIFTPGNIDIIRKISDAVKPFDKIQRVMSLTEAEIATGVDDTVEFPKIIPDTDKLTPDILEKARKKALESDILPGTLISKDCTTTAIIIELDKIKSNEIKKKVLEKIQKTAEKIANGKVKLHYSGGPFLEVEISNLTSKDNNKFTPITFFIIMFITYYMLGSKGLSFLGQLNIIIIVLWGIGLLIMCGESINSVTVIIAPVLLAISIADSIHILSHYRETYLSNGNNHKKAVYDTVKSLWLPCFFTSATTAIGYLSFLTTSVRAVKIVGIFTAAGVMIAFVLTVFFLPSVLMLFHKKLEKSFVNYAKTNKKSAKNTEKHSILLYWLGDFTTKRYIIISLIFIFITTIVGGGISKLVFDTNFVNYLKNSNKIKQDIIFIEKNLRGTVPVELVIEASSPEYDFSHPESMKLLEKIQNNIITHMEGRYTTTFSAADYFKEINQAFNSGKKDAFRIPDSRLDLIDYYETGDAEILDRYVSPDKMKARLSFSSRFGSTKKSLKFTNYLKNHVSKMLGDKFSYKFTGLSSLYLKMDHNLKISQLRSFGTAFILIFIMMLFVCKNFSLTIISMLPNIFPIAVTLGIMGWAGIPLDTSTIMIASVTIGIAVDDTIHFVTWFRRNRLNGMTTEEALKQTFIDTGKPIIMTSVVLCIAYFVLMTGSVKPIIAFGILAGLAMFFALIGDLFILPASIMILKPKFKSSKTIETENSSNSIILAKITD